ncbi:hypothetical protein AB0M36_34930 [Actinoplanes sp. NPDC051346]|uniref:hypothetical protein n=1 Tax=Actinoplanes sp. NPDC051346 TaxID=3155048 RepID=UPI0034271695
MVISTVGSDRVLTGCVPSGRPVDPTVEIASLAAGTGWRSDLIRSLGSSLIPVLSNVQPVPAIENLSDAAK